MSKKKKKKKSEKIIYSSNTFCGFPLNVKNINRLWNWNTLEEVEIHKIF